VKEVNGVNVCTELIKEKGARSETYTREREREAEDHGAPGGIILKL